MFSAQQKDEKTWHELLISIGTNKKLNCPFSGS